MAEKCSSCGAPVVLARTVSGKAIYLDERVLQVAVFVDASNSLVEVKRGRQSHFATCTNAAAHRKAAPRERRDAAHMGRCNQCSAFFKLGRPGSRFSDGRDYCSARCVELERGET